MDNSIDPLAICQLAKVPTPRFKDAAECRNRFANQNRLMAFGLPTNSLITKSVNNPTIASNSPVEFAYKTSFRAGLMSLQTFLLIILLSLFSSAVKANNLLTNGSFESPNVPVGDNDGFPGSAIPGWDTANLELWGLLNRNIPAADEQQVAELNRGSAKEVWQDFSSTPGETLTIEFAHRGREETETLELRIGPPNATVRLGSFSASTGSWTNHSSTYVVPAGQTQTRIEFRSLMGNNNRGNLIDDVRVLSDGASGGGNQPPVAVADGAPISGTAPHTVNFSGAGSSDPDGDDLTYDWDFGDGTTRTQRNPPHTYTTAGTFTATLTVTDEDGLSDTDAIVVDVSNEIVSNEDRRRIAAVNDIVLAMQSYGAANGTYEVTNSGRQGTGQGWLYRVDAPEYEVALSSTLIADGHLNTPPPTDPLLENIGDVSVFDFQIFRCLDRIAVFSYSDSVLPTEADQQWWQSRNCPDADVANTGHNYFKLSVPLADSDSTTIPVFAGAQGFGVNTKAGKEGTVCTVENLDDSGPGSLRHCVGLDEPRSVHFAIGGEVELESTLEVISPFISILGQTAPAPGITIKTTTDVRGPVIQIATHDVLMQHLRVRADISNPDGVTCCRDTISIGSPIPNSVYNVVLDHNSFSWATDEVVEIWFDAHDITLSWNIIAEGLHNANNMSGPAGRGMLVGRDSYNISIHHNLFAHNFQRNPSIANKGTNDVVNNVIYHWISRGAQLSNQSGPNYTNLTKNLFIAHTDPGQSHPTTVGWYDVELVNATSDVLSVYFEGNIGHWRTNNLAPQWSLAATDFEQPYTPDLEFHTHYRHDTPPVDEYAASEIEELLAESVGATQPQRDSIDTRILQELQLRTGTRKDCVSGCQYSATD